MKKPINFIADLLFPPRCAVCGEVTAIATEICEDCVEALTRRFDGETLCARCGKPPSSCVCSRETRFARCVSVFEYCEDTRLLFQRLKNSADSPAAVQLAGMMAQMASAKLDVGGFDWVTSVPASDESLAEKGFDHARRLAEELGRRIGVPYLEPPIARSGGYRAQHSLDSRERYENVQSGYAVREGRTVSGKLLLADDIITTGATLDRCAELLLECGADEVFCITAATTLLK